MTEKVSFSSIRKTAQEEQQPELVARPQEAEPAVATAVVPAGESGIVPHDPQAASLSRWVEGEYGARDIKLPRINLVQNVGDLPTMGFTAGSFVLNKSVVLAERGEPLEIVVLRARKQYQEVVPFPEQGNTFDTMDEVRKAGGHDVYGEKGCYRPILHMQVLVKKPDRLDAAEDDDQFIYSFGGASYAMAMFTAGGKTYTTTAKPFLTAMATNRKLRSSVPAAARWSITGEASKGAINTTCRAMLHFAGYNDADVAAAMQELAG